MPRTPAEILHELADSLTKCAEFNEAAATVARSPLFRDALEMSATVFHALACAIGEAADGNDISPVAELADLASEWHLNRVVGTPATDADACHEVPATV